MRAPRLSEACGNGWLDFSWPALAICAFLGGAIIATQSNPKAFAETLRSLRASFAFSGGHNVETGRVLVLTADPAQQLVVVATLSPRGFDPLLAGNLAEANRQIATHRAALRFAVLDGALRDTPSIARALRASLPACRIVVIPPAKQREAIAQMLLDRL